MFSGDSSCCAFLLEWCNNVRGYIKIILNVFFFFGALDGSVLISGSYSIGIRLVGNLAVTTNLDVFKLVSSRQKIILGLLQHFQFDFNHEFHCKHFRLI